MSNFQIIFAVFILVILTMDANSKTLQLPIPPTYQLYITYRDYREPQETVVHVPIDFDSMGECYRQGDREKFELETNPTVQVLTIACFSH